MDLHKLLQSVIIKDDYNKLHEGGAMFYILFVMVKPWLPEYQLFIITEMIKYHHGENIRMAPEEGKTNSIVKSCSWSLNNVTGQLKI